MLTIVVVQFLIIHNIAILERLTAFVRGKKSIYKTKDFQDLKDNLYK